MKSYSALLSAFLVTSPAQAQDVPSSQLELLKQCYAMPFPSEERGNCLKSFERTAIKVEDNEITVEASQMDALSNNTDQKQPASIVYTGDVKWLRLVEQVGSIVKVYRGSFMLPVS